MALITLQPTLTLLCSFADRDMFARFAGIGVGHEVQYTSSAIKQHSNKYWDDAFSCRDDSSDEEDAIKDGDAEGDVIEEINMEEGDVEEDDVEEDDDESDVSEDSNSSTEDIDEPEESDSDGEDDSDDDDNLYYRF